MIMIAIFIILSFVIILMFIAYFAENSTSKKLRKELNERDKSYEGKELEYQAIGLKMYTDLANINKITNKYSQKLQCKWYGDKLVVPIEYAEWLYNEKAKINKTPRNKLVLTLNNKVCEIPENVIDEWDFTGLNNMDFILSGQWKQTIKT